MFAAFRKHQPMARRWRPRLPRVPLPCFFSLAALTFPLVASGAPAAPDAPPNVLLIIADDQAWSDYGFMGHPHIATPRLDRLAAESVLFMRGYVASPLCRPSLASILTGLPTHRHGVTGNDPATHDPVATGLQSRTNPRFSSLHKTLYRRISSAPNVARLLRDAGYATMQTGKWWEGDPGDYGFTSAMTHGDPLRGGRHGDEGLTISRQGIEPIRKFLDSCAAANGKASLPFFIWHAPFLPHAPHTPPADLLEKYRRRAPTPAVASYWAMCEWFDQTCGELLDEIDGRGLRDSTLVLYLADNGWIQDPEKPGQFGPRSKGTPYEGGVRTPFLVRWPSRATARRDGATLVSATDIAPTIINAARLPIPPGWQGVDLLDAEGLRRRGAVFGSQHPHDIQDVHEPNRACLSRYALVGPWKLIVHNRVEGLTDRFAPLSESSTSGKRRELFQVESDPYETTDLAASKPETADAIEKELDAWWSGTSAAFPE